MARMTDKVFFSEAELTEMGYGSRSTLWRLRQEGKFPKTVKISKGRAATPADWIENYHAKLVGDEPHEE